MNSVVQGNTHGVRSVAVKVWIEALKNVLFYGVGILIAIFFVKVVGWEWVGWIALVGFGVVFLFSIFSTLVALGSAIAGTFYLLRKGGDHHGQTWLWLGCLGRVAEDLICIGLLFWLYRIL